MDGFQGLGSQPHALAQTGPDFFHFAQHKGFGADLRPVAVIEHLVKPAESFDALRFSIVQIHKPRMIQKAPAAHDAFRSGIAPLELPQRFGGEKITVIAHGELAFPKGVVVPLPMRASAVLLRPAAGMQDQPPGRVSVEQLQQGGPFLRAFHAQPGLEGHGHRRFFENSVQKAFQLLRVGQQPRAPVLAHHRAGGAAQIDVDLLVAQRFQLVRRPEKVLAAVGQDLGHGLHTGVILR